MPASEARYERIAKHLRRLVARGAPRDRLPSDAELCEQFSVSRMTARQAVQLLVNEGLVVRRRGRGTFVAGSPVARTLGSPLSFSESMRRRGLRASSTILRAEVASPAPEDVETLGLRERDRVVVLERLRLADDVPMAIERAVLVPSLITVLQEDLQRTSLHAAMEKLGRIPTRAHATATAQPASPLERRLLELSPRDVLICEHRVIWDQHGEPLEHTETRYASQRYRFEAVLRRDEQGGGLMASRRLVGLDLGGTNVKTVVLEETEGEPRVVATSTAPARAEGGPDAVVDRLIELGRAALADHGPIDAVGVGVPGLFDRGTGVIELFPNLLGPWPGHPFRDPVAAGLGMPVTLINDARAFTLAEGRLGAGRGCRLLACVTLGTGVGGGILIDGRVELGEWGRAGEIGHQTVLPDGPLCGCGNRGCVEPLAQADALAELAERATAEEVYRGVRDGDERCISAVETVAGYLGIALANVVTVVGPRRIVIGGGISAAGELVVAPIRDAVRRRVTLVPPEDIEVTAAELGPAAGAIGAALAAGDAAEG